MKKLFLLLSIISFAYSQNYVLTYEWVNGFPTMSKGKRIILSSDSSIWRSDGQSWQHIGYADGVDLWATTDSIIFATKYYVSQNGGSTDSSIFASKSWSNNQLAKIGDSIPQRTFSNIKYWNKADLDTSILNYVKLSLKWNKTDLDTSNLHYVKLSNKLDDSDTTTVIAMQWELDGKISKNTATIGSKANLHYANGIIYKSTDTASGSGIPYSDTTSVLGMQWELDGKQNKYANITDTSTYLQMQDSALVWVSRAKLSNENYTKDSTVTKLIAGTNITVTKSTGSGSWKVDAAGGGSGFTYSKRTADTTNSAVALVNCGSMNFPVVSGTNYYFKFVITYSTAALTTGLRTALTTPTFTNFSASADHYGQAVDGVGTPWAGTINTSGDVVVSGAVAVINVNYTAIIEGRILPSANGTVWLQIGSEVAASAITIRNGSFVMYQSY